MHSRKSGAVLALTVVLVAAACGSSTKKAGTGAAATTTVAGAASGSAKSLLNGEIKCTQQYKGKEIHIFSPTRDSGTDHPVADFIGAYKPFEDCTGAKMVWEGTDGFETEIKVRLAGGNAPDIIDFPQPGLLSSLASKGQLKVFPANVQKHLTNDFVGGWAELGTVDGKGYGLPARANVKSFVWYSPADFKAKGYAIPTTLDEMKTLSDKIAADGGTPWCAGIESGTATGWPVTDWFEDGMLRFNTPEDYDAWVAGTLKFSDPKVVKVADWVGSYLKNPKYLGGDNAVKAIATTKFQSGGLPILDHKCYMHRQASFYSGIWPAGTKIGPDGQVDTFYLPVAKTGDKKVMLGGGDLYGAGTNKPETMDVLRYVNSNEYYLGVVGKDGKPDTSTAGLSTRKDFDTSKLQDPVQKGFAEQLKSSDVFRFDGSDMMPGAIGSGAFWKEATAWIVGGSTDNMLNNIETAWKALPAS